MKPCPAHVRFVAAVQRRMSAHRLFEASVFAFCTACVVAVVAERVTGGGQIVALATALIVATSCLSRRWPTASDAAKLIDSQLGWNELLQSAMASSRGVHADHLGHAVAAVADARCVNADIRSFKFGRLSAAQKLFAVVALLSSAAVWIAPHGATPSKSSAKAIIDNPSPLVDAETVTGSSPRQTIASSTAVDEPSSRRGGAEPVDSKSVDSSPPGRRGESSGGSGLGSAMANGSVNTTATSDATASPKTGDAVGGDGVGAMATQSSRGASGGVVVQASKAGAMAWSGGVLHRDPIDGSASHAASAVDRDRDLIRAYFDR